MKLDFVKENRRWFIDLPEWSGSKADLEMVCGADDLLDIFSNGKDKVSILLETEPTKDYHRADLVELHEIEGATYNIFNIDNRVIDLNFWLCNVTLYVLKSYPPTLYLKVVS